MAITKKGLKMVFEDEECWPETDLNILLGILKGDDRPREAKIEEILSIPLGEIREALDYLEWEEGVEEEIAERT